MTWKFLYEDETTPTTNQFPGTFPQWIFNLKRALKARSWVVTQSSDGTTYNAAGDQITSGGSGAGGMDNPRAWFVIHSPDSKVWWCFQKDTTASGGNSYQWRIKVAFANFGSGSPSATQTPACATATNETYLKGGGTDASPTFAALFASAISGWRQHIAVMSTAPYAFWTVGWQGGRPAPNDTFIFYDPLASGTYPSADTTPFVVGASYANQALSLASISNYNWVKPMNSAGVKTWSAVTVATLYTSGYSARVVPPDSTSSMVNCEDGSDTQIRPWWVRASGPGAPFGVVGQSSIIRWNSVYRTTGDTFTVSTSRDAVMFEDVVLDWDGSIVVI